MRRVYAMGYKKAKNMMPEIKDFIMHRITKDCYFVGPKTAFGDNKITEKQIYSKKNTGNILLSEKKIVILHRNYYIIWQLLGLSLSRA